MDQDLANLLRAASENPQYKLLMDYLMARRAVPEMKVSNYMGGGTTGEFVSPGFFKTEDRPPVTGRLTVLSRSNQQDMIATLLHELTHAAERQMDWQYSESTRRPGILSARGSTQFSEAYGKLRNGKDARSTVPADFVKAEKDYRASYDELPAFGMGSTVKPNSYAAPLHTDPSQATDVITLLNLALKEMQTRPQSQGR